MCHDCGHGVLPAWTACPWLISQIQIGRPLVPLVATEQRIDVGHELR